jgi:hypothetical protein
MLVVRVASEALFIAKPFSAFFTPDVAFAVFFGYGS